MRIQISLSLWILAFGCSLSEDFDRAWPDDTLWNQCSDVCRETVDCLAAADCPGLANSAASRGIVDGSCVSGCYAGEGQVHPDTEITAEQCAALTREGEMKAICRSGGLCAQQCGVGEGDSPWLGCLEAGGVAEIRRLRCMDACEAQSRAYWACTAENVSDLKVYAESTDALTQCAAYTSPDCVDLLSVSDRWGTLVP